jgi:hypothetical protein
MKSEFQNLDRMFPKPRPQHEQNIPDIHSIHGTIPSREICDVLVELYVSNFESVHRIFHIPTLYQNYHQFWNSNYETNPSLYKEFAPQLALIAMMGSKLCNQELLATLLAPIIFNAPKIISMVETWLFNLSNKHRAQVSTLQTHCLLVLAKQMLSTPPSQLPRYSGDLVRSALSLGLHRDPEEFSELNTSVLQVEVRRRLWLTVMELDVQISTACCMPSLVQTVEYTCRYPTEISDRDIPIDIDEKQTLESNAASIANASIQIALAQSLPLRLNALRLLTQVQPDADEVDEILRELECQRASLDLLLGSDPRMLLKAIMLDMCIRRPMLSLYTLQNQRLAGADNDHVQRAAKAFTDAALVVMSHSETLDPDLTDQETVVGDRYWTVFQAIHMDDLLRAAYGACMAMRLISLNMSRQTHPDTVSSNRRCLFCKVFAYFPSPMRSSNRPSLHLNSLTS